MVIKHRDTLRAAISGDIADNGVGAIDAQDIRENLINIIDSCPINSTGSLDVATSGDAVGGTGVSALLYSPEVLKAAIKEHSAAITGQDVVVVNDTTPELGGNLDVGTFCIVSVSDRDIYIHPDGAGAIGPSGTQDLGDYSTNFQRAFIDNTKTSSGDYSVLMGGKDNSVALNGLFGVVGGGTGNTVSQDHSTIAGGAVNTIDNDFSFIGGGSGNTAHSSSRQHM